MRPLRRKNDRVRGGCCGKNECRCAAIKARAAALPARSRILRGIMACCLLCARGGGCGKNECRHAAFYARGAAAAGKMNAGALPLTRAAALPARSRILRGIMARCLSCARLLSKDRNRRRREILCPSAAVFLAVYLGSPGLCGQIRLSQQDRTRHAHRHSSRIPIHPHAQQRTNRP